mmetsp:Transcript_45045/g.107019  ORF Transcript_45045/g.107019 Transcript_45045/m.107019 type:complete len:579 (+) Transcript_45045:45-1781(+)
MASLPKLSSESCGRVSAPCSRKVRLLSAGYLACIVTAVPTGAAGGSIPCLQDDVIAEVCVCHVDHCDTVAEMGRMSDDILVYYQTSQGGTERLTRYSVDISQASIALDELDREATGWEVAVDIGEQYQEIVGFGGALTDAAAINVHSLDAGVQAMLLESYYGDTGIRYTLGRVPMASCDFSTHVYSYAEVQEDMALEHFSIEVDFDSSSTGAKLPFIKDVQSKVRSRRVANSLTLFASPWAPPAWMTVENRTTGNPHLRDECREPWAKYFSKFLTAYRSVGVDIWAVTAENEPNGNLGTWQALKFTPQTHMEFIRDFLGPTLRKDHPKVKIMMHDDQRAYLPSWTAATLGGNNSATEFVDGIGVHWYASLNDKVVWITRPFDKMKATHEKFPDKFILATEACAGYLPLIDQGPSPGSWSRAELYAFDILNDLNSWAVGWTDWNIALDMQGGPNWARNFVDSPILVDAARQRFLKNPMFYALGHFSRFIVPGSRRIKVTSTAPAGQAPIEATAFITPDKLIVCVVLNRGGRDRHFVFRNGARSKSLMVPAHSMQTIIVTADLSSMRSSFRRKIFAEIWQ